MAKVSPGPLVGSIRGKVGNVIFQFCNGVQIAREMPQQIHDPHTPRQMDQRAAFAQAINEWNALTIAEREEWNAWAAIQGSKQQYRADLRVDSCVGRTHGGLVDGHNSVVAIKSYERSVTPQPFPIDLPKYPPWKKTASLPPWPLQVIAVKGQAAAVIPDGIYWTWKDRVEEVDDAIGRVWTAPPRPVHKQQICIEDPAWPAILETIGGAASDGAAGSSVMRVGDSEIVIFPDPGPPPAGVAAAAVGVWRNQLDEMDDKFLPSFLSEIYKFKIEWDLADGYWLLYPTVEALPGPP